MQLFELLRAKRHVIWDWNGTLIDDLDCVVDLVNRFLAEHSLPAVDRERYRRIFRFPVRDMYLDLGLRVTDDEFCRFSERFVQRYHDASQQCTLAPGMLETIERITSSGMRQSILSAADQGTLEMMLRRYGIRHHFDEVFGLPNKFAGSKLQRGLELVTSLDGYVPESTVLVGDTLHDLEVGRELGIDVVLVTHGHQCPTILRQEHSEIFWTHAAPAAQFSANHDGRSASSRAG